MTGPRIARIAVFAALVAVFGLTPGIPVPGISVPLTAQTFAVMLAGLMLVPLEAFLAVALFVGLVATGLKVLPGGVGGLDVFTTPRAGFVLGFPVAALTVAVIFGTLMRLGLGRWAKVPQLVGAFAAAVVGGIVVLYAIGVPVGAWRSESSLGAFFTAMMAFVPWDLLKAGAAAVVAVSAFRAAPFLRPFRTAESGAA